MLFWRIVPSIILLAITASPQATKRPANPKDTIPFHTVEPVVIRDGSVKIDVYARKTSDSHVEGDVIITGASPTSQARFNVPVRVVPVRIGPPNKPGTGRVETVTGLAHKMTQVDSYVCEIEKFDGRRFVPYTQLEFKFVNLSWRISPKGSNPLKLVAVGQPVILSGAWAEHTETTYEYGYENLRLRVGSVTITGRDIGSMKINVGTGCTAFRIEPSTHQPHPMPFNDEPCAKAVLDPKEKFAGVLVKGVRPVQAIDVSLARAAR